MEHCNCDIIVTFQMPIKWLALESIQHRIFTHKSDVWSYGERSQFISFFLVRWKHLHFKRATELLMAMVVCDCLYPWCAGSNSGAIHHEKWDSIVVSYFKVGLIWARFKVEADESEVDVLIKPDGFRRNEGWGLKHQPSTSRTLDRILHPTDFNSNQPIPYWL